VVSQPTVPALIDQALEAYERLVEVGEAVSDEGTYLRDLSAAWRARLGVVADQRGAETGPPGAELAIGRATEEAGRITDPHRAIDWLSTFPQVVLIGLGERP
jgi:hypothetical protein